MKFLKDWSYCKELEIQYVPVKKKPIPKKYPTQNKLIKYGFFLYLFLDLLLILLIIKKRIVKMKKFIITKLNG